MPLMTRRSSTRGLPGLPRGRCGSIAAQASLDSQNRRVITTSRLDEPNQKVESPNKAIDCMSSLPSAQTYPSRPVRIIVGFAPAGATDICARLIGQWLSERLNQQFVIENRPGAGSNIATEAVIRAPTDGYTLLLAGAPAAFNATLYDNLNFNFLRDIAPVAGIMRAPNVMVVNLGVPAETVPEFI